MSRWLLAAIFSLAAFTGHAQAFTFESPPGRVSLLELFTSEG